MPKVEPCKYGDPFCPCPDGDMCHYEGDNPMKQPKEPTMQIELTDEDRKIVALISEADDSGVQPSLLEDCYSYGIKAGIERAAKVAEYPCADSICAAAIRALLQPLP